MEIIEMTPRQKLLFIAKNSNTADYPSMVKAAFSLNTQQTKSMRFQAVLAALLHKELHCYICGSQIINFSTKDEPHFENGESMTYEHVFPSCFNGGNHILNGRAACSKCNREKSDSLEFDTFKGRFKVVPERRYHLRDLMYILKKKMTILGVSESDYIGCLLHYFYDTKHSLMNEEQVRKFEQFCAFVNVPVDFGDLTQFKEIFIGILKPV